MENGLSDSGWKYPPSAFLFILITTALLCLLSLWLDLTGLRLITKWVPAIVLACWVWQATSGSPRLYACIGLVLSAIGDLTLEGNYIAADSGIPWFAVGLGFFLLAHCSYIPLFLSLSHRRTWKPYLPISIYVGGFIVLLWGELGALRVPVVIYMLVISLMIWSALCVNPTTHTARWQRYSAAWGAVIFAASDSMIAINKFLQPFTGAREAILLTYWIAQFGIASAAVNFPRSAPLPQQHR